MNDLLNVQDYTVFQVSLNLAASLCWVFAYISIIRNIREHQFVEMPLIAATGNITWEFLWSFYFKINMGTLLIWGIRAWLLLDIYIVYGLYMYGQKQFQTPALRDNHRKLMGAMVIVWGLFFFTLPCQGYDTPMGAHSALILNLIMSIAYVVQLARHENLAYLSPSAALMKGIGTGLFSLFVVIATPYDHLSIALGSLVFAADLLYATRLLQLRRATQPTELAVSEATI